MTGGELRLSRMKLGLKSSELAGELGVSPYTVSRWENDRQSIPLTVDLAMRYLHSQRELQSPADRLVDAIKEIASAGT